MSPLMALDANVALKWVLPPDEEPEADKAVALLNASLDSSDGLLVAPHFFSEVLNVLYRRTARGANPMPAEDARTALETMLTAPVTVVSNAALYPRALAIAQAYRLPSAYDALYVAVAESAGCDLWTDDRRLLRALEGRLPYVRWIGDWP